MVVLPEQEGLWNFRFIRHSTCDKNGRFEIALLRPGASYVVALDRIEDTGLDRLSTLRSLAALATPIALDPGRSTRIDLKLQRWPE